MNFANSESGAVTVDWVVLTAALVGLGLAAMSIVSSGVEDTSGDIEGQLSSQTIYTSFNQSNFSDYYQAVMELNALDSNYFGGAGAQYFENDVNQFTSNSDEVLVGGLTSLSLWSYEGSVDQYAALSAIDPSTATVSSLAADAGYSEAYVQNRLDQFGGDMNTVIEAELAANNVTIKRFEAQAAEADSRGLTY